jgi:hypothetical protein
LQQLNAGSAQGFEAGIFKKQMRRRWKMKSVMTRIAAALLLASASTGALAFTPEDTPIRPTSGVFSMYSQGGFDTSGVVANFDAPINVDATITASINWDIGTWEVSSYQFFYGLQWTASNGSLITRSGDYGLTTTGYVTWGGGPVANDGTMYFTVGPNQIAGVIDFAWGASSGIRVVNVWDINPDFSLTAASVAGMENGPFPGFNAAFDFGPVATIPEASTYTMLLAGLGLIGAAARRKAKPRTGAPS